MAKQNSTLCQGDPGISTPCQSDQPCAVAQDKNNPAPVKDKFGGANNLNNNPAPEPDHQEPADRLTMMAEHLITAHKAQYGGVEVSRQDMRSGFPKAAKLLLAHTEVQRYWKSSDEVLAKSYVKFLWQLAKEKRWQNKAHGGTYCSGDFIDKFVESNEAILSQKRIERHREEEKRKEELKRENEKWRREQQEEFERAEQEFQKGGRPCFADPMKKEWCRECRSTTHDKWFRCQFDRGGRDRYRYDEFQTFNRLTT